MLNFDKQYSVRRVLERIVTEDDLITAVFKDIPELQEFTWSKTSEYDDNNYSDYSRLNTINGYAVDYDGDYEEFGDDESIEPQSNMPRIEDRNARHTIRDLVDSIADGFDHREDIVISREEYLPKVTRTVRAKADREELDYVRSYMSGKTLPDSFFLKLENPKWAIYYADDHGRFSEDMEFKIFAQEGRMHYAYLYARHIIKGPLPEKIENFYLLNNSEEDKEDLKVYLDFKKAA